MFSPPRIMIFDAIDDVKKAVLVQVAHVAGVEPAIDESFGGGLGFIPVAHHVGRRLDTYLAPLARGQWLAVPPIRNSVTAGTTRPVLYGLAT